MLARTTAGLAPTNKVKRMIVNGEPEDKIQQKAMEQGMKTLRLEGVSQALEGTTSLDELLRVIDMRKE